MSYTNGLDKPSNYFVTKLYTGNGASSHAISGVGFQSDWTWIKNRSSAVNHALTDSVRSAPLRLMSQSTEAEINQTTGLLSFNSDGFTVGADSGYNGNGNSMVSWNWKAGTSFTNDASSTGIGTIDSAGSFNNDAGFSIVTYTGTASNATIKHGLNSVPKMIIYKMSNGTKNWLVYHVANGNTHAQFLNTTSAKDAASTYFQDTTPTSSVFSIGTDTHVNDTQNYVAYCFAEKQGYSKFGSYTGNGNADGTFVYTGFKPAFVIRKVTSASSDWIMQDNKRSESGGSNQIRNYLFPNSSQAEVSSQDYFNIDFLSNGFKMRSTDGGANGSGSSYIYMAFAENPFVTSTGVPATAR
jgi:hypothetical protein